MRHAHEQEFAEFFDVASPRLLGAAWMLTGEQQSAEFLVVGGVGVPDGVVGERGGDAFARHDVEDPLRELLRHRERRGDEVRDVQSLERAAVVDFGRQQRIELVAELGDALAQQR